MWSEERIQEVIRRQNTFFRSGKTLDTAWRIRRLKRLRQAVCDHENEILAALRKDLGRAEAEGYFCDIGTVILEINEMIAGLPRWSRPETHASGIVCFPSTTTKVYKMPYGTVLLISPFNFPFTLTLGPLAAAIAGGAGAASAGQKPTILVEEFIPGRELTVGVIDGEPLPVIEIVAKGGWYGYQEKYESNETRYPFLEDGDLSRRLQKTAVDAYNAVGCRGVTRVDFRVSPLGRCYVLELNTSPGFTSHSLVPKAGMKTGLTFAGVCERILGSARHD